MTTQPSDFTEFPSEIIAKPLALVGLSGLDTINNAVHKTIWDAFSNNRRPDRSPVRFKLLNNTFEFPVVKPKRNSYEWYIPKGILKRNWINKRISLIPSVIVIFYDLEWSDLQWNEKVIECASRVQSIRAAIEGHATRVAVVVVQSGLSPAPSEYMQGAEKAQALCAACEIQSKSLFILPHSDHLMGYIIRLENAFYDIAQSYYHHETKNIKLHRDHLNKTTHQYLFVRHQFKLGFLNELKQDISTAHKHYLHAYNNLLETRTVDTNVNEIRTVAGYINFKLCKLLFALNLPRDAITQLKSHIERFKSRIGATELLFEHYAWIARQYSAFGEIFDEAIRSGLPAIQSQHPGFYYQYAAQFTVKRRQAMRSVCTETVEYPPSPDPLEGTVEFYGQRPWRPGRLSADPHDPQKEQAAISALQHKEQNFNHSVMIISFLGSAISQFKTFHSPRMRKQLVVEMANEYYICSDYGKALTLLTHMLWDYRREKWWYLASHILNRALECAYLSGKIQDYVQLAIEALSKHITVYNNDKQRIFNNIVSILNLNIPSPEPNIPAYSHLKALESWKTVIDKEPLNIIIDMLSSSFLEVKPTFKKQKYKSDELITVEIYVRLTFPTKLEVKTAYITISSHSETVEVPLTDGDVLMLLKSGEVKKFLCEFKPNPEDIGNDLYIKNVSITLGWSTKRKIVLNFKIDENKIADTTKHPELLHLMTCSKSDYEFDNIIPSTVAHISARDSKLEINIVSDTPALQGEWFPNTLVITNHELTTINNIEIVTSVLNSPDNSNTESTIELSLTKGITQQHPLHSCLDNIGSNITHSQFFYLKSNKTMTVNILVKVLYKLKSSEGKIIEGTKDFTFKITIIKPFEVSYSYVSMKFQPITKCIVNDSFIVIPQIRILSPWDLYIEDTELDLSESFSYCDEGKPNSCISGLLVREAEVATDAICIQANTLPKEVPTRIGLYNIKWKRRRKENDFPTSVLSTASLPGLNIVECPVSVSTNYPETVELRKSVPLACTIKANSNSTTHLNMTIDGVDAFMFSGYKKRSVTVVPHQEIDLCYNLHPLICGNATSPSIKLVPELDSPDYSEIFSNVFNRSLPENIYVMPKSEK